MGWMEGTCCAHGRNSSLLLNVGPNRQGEITGSSIKALAEIGKLRNPKADRVTVRPPQAKERN